MTAIRTSMFQSDSWPLRFTHHTTNTPAAASVFQTYKHLRSDARRCAHTSGRTRTSARAWCTIKQTHPQRYWETNINSLHICIWIHVNKQVHTSVERCANWDNTHTQTQDTIFPSHHLFSQQKLHSARFWYKNTPVSNPLLVLQHREASHPHSLQCHTFTLFAQINFRCQVCSPAGTLCTGSDELKLKCKIFTKTAVS